MKAFTRDDLPAVARSLPPGQEIMQGPNHVMQAALGRAIRRHEVSRVSPVYMDARHPGTVYVIVQRHKPPQSPWVRPVLIASAVVPAVLGLGYAVKYVVDSVAGAVSQAGPTLGALAVCALILFTAARLVRGGRWVEGTFRGRIVRK